MYRIAIVEDESEAAMRLKEMLLSCAKEQNTPLEVVCFSNGVVFLTGYQANYDIVFLDIEMPYLDGMECAKKLREMDHTTLLIFVTNLGHMAPQGYAVEAFDFLVKPLQYDLLSAKLLRAFGRLEKTRVRNISFLSEGSRYVYPASEIRYLEVIDHRLIYHTDSGNYPSYGTLSGIREKLEPLGFFLCNSCYLVNLRFVRRIEKYTVTVGEDQLQISHPKKKAFMKALNDYIGG